MNVALTFVISTSRVEVRITMKQLDRRHRSLPTARLDNHAGQHLHPLRNVKLIRVKLNVEPFDPYVIQWVDLSGSELQITRPGPKDPAILLFPGPE